MTAKVQGSGAPRSRLTDGGPSQSANWKNAISTSLAPARALGKAPGLRGLTPTYTFRRSRFLRTASFVAWSSPTGVTAKFLARLGWPWLFVQAISQRPCQRRWKIRPHGGGIAGQLNAVFCLKSRFFVRPGWIDSSSRPALFAADAHSGGQGGPQATA